MDKSLLIVETLFKKKSNSISVRKCNECVCTATACSLEFRYLNARDKDITRNKNFHNFYILLKKVHAY
jgi:hypothetical protein